VNPIGYLETSALLCGDNLELLAQFPSDCIDLIYLDPPFFSNRQYEVIWGDEAEVRSFEDRWKGGIEVYVEWMHDRIVHMHRVLKPTGSLYLHCDPTASHYLKVMADRQFGRANFRNEIIWQRSGIKGDAQRKLATNHDVILAYGKTDSAYFKPPRREPDEAYLGRFSLDDHDGRGLYRLAPLDSPNPRPNLTYEYKGYAPPAKGWRISPEIMERLDSEGRLAFPTKATGRIARKHYLREQEWPRLGDVWTDIPPLQAASTEKLGYPTQKPEALLERIISSAAERDGIVLDPFCGCGTTLLSPRSWSDSGSESTLARPQ
jgi:DNA modification methylase